MKVPNGDSFGLFAGSTRATERLEGQRSRLDSRKSDLSIAQPLTEVEGLRILLELLVAFDDLLTVLRLRRFKYRKNTKYRIPKYRIQNTEY